MAEIATALWRSVRKEDFPQGTVIEGQPAPCVLYPDFYARLLPNGAFREADVELVRDKNGVEWVKSLGGTSLFDKKNVFKGKSWLSFEIPEGTPVPESLVVRKTNFNQRYQANHYQIECASKTMRVDAFKGALDSLARNAIARSVELA